jgi:hypothetical protein
MLNREEQKINRAAESRSQNCQPRMEFLGGKKERMVSDRLAPGLPLIMK